MKHDCHVEKIYVARVGHLETTRVNQILFSANQVQRAFEFDYISDHLTLDESFKLANGSYDICAAVKQQLVGRRGRKLPRPLFLISSDGLGDAEFPSDPDALYFSSQETDYDPQVAIISTKPMQVLNKCSLDSYLLMLLSSTLFAMYGNLAFHDGVSGCPLDYCEKLEDAERCLMVGRLCSDCEVLLQRSVGTNRLTLEKVASMIRLLNRSVRRRYCFVIMPFDHKLDGVYRCISDTLTKLGWEVKRSDDLAYPKLITDRILRETLVSDLVIADTTDLNPNVFYEIGMAHMVGQDLVMLTQNGREIPFDIANEHVIEYSAMEMNGLASRLGQMVRGHSRN